MIGSEWQRTLITACAGFVAAVVVQVFAEWWKELRQRKMLRRSLYQEVVTIQHGLGELLELLGTSEDMKRDASPADLPAFVRADCYETARSTPLFWRLGEALDLLGIHQQLHYLAVRKPSDQAGDAIAVELTLKGVQARIAKSLLKKRLMGRLQREASHCSRLSST